MKLSVTRSKLNVCFDRKLKLKNRKQNQTFISISVSVEIVDRIADEKVKCYI